MKSTKILNVTKVVAKIAEVFNWVGAALMLCATVCSLAAPSWVTKFVSLDAKEGAVELNTYGFEITAPMLNGLPDMKTFFIFGIGAIILLVLMAMIFRNMYLIVKRSEENETCFDDDNIRMMREIGIFSIALPLVGLLMSIIARLVTGNVDIEINVNLYGVFIGIIVLGLTQFFIHGKELEKEVEGLV